MQDYMSVSTLSRDRVAKGLMRDTYFDGVYNIRLARGDFRPTHGLPNLKQSLGAVS